MGRSKRSLVNPLSKEKTDEVSNESVLTVSEKPPQLPEIDLAPLDFAVTRAKRASVATNPDANYGLDLWDVRLSYNVGRRSLIRDKDEIPDFSNLPEVPDLPSDLRTLHSSKMKEVLGMDLGDETEVERDGSDTPDSMVDLKGDEPVPEYIHGWKLFSVMLAITLACFLYLLDVSILVTVSPSKPQPETSMLTFTGYSENYQ